jgi:23S rRNA pseudouridine2457 synthase
MRRGLHCAGLMRALRIAMNWKNSNRGAGPVAGLIEPGSVLLFNKPFGVLSQFKAEGARRGLADYISIPAVYAAGRLDADSEGLLLLTDDGALQKRITDPKHKLPKTYWVQVECEPNDDVLQRLHQGLDLGDFVTRAAQAKTIAEPAGLWPRDPPIRVRKAIPTAWLQIEISEGKNRQVRRMTAKLGFPTLRLVRAAIGPWRLDGLLPGQIRWEKLTRKTG